MNAMIIFFALFAVACSQRVLPLPLRDVGDGDEYAASLGGAPVGVYGKRTDGQGGSEVYGASLAGAKVGVYGKDRPRRLLPLRPIVPLVKPLLPAPYFPGFFGPRFNPYYFPYLPFQQGSLATAGAVADSLRQRSSARATGYESSFYG